MLKSLTTTDFLRIGVAVLSSIGHSEVPVSTKLRICVWPVAASRIRNSPDRKGWLSTSQQMARKIQNVIKIYPPTLVVTATKELDTRGSERQLREILFHSLSQLVNKLLFSFCHMFLAALSFCFSVNLCGGHGHLCLRYCRLYHKTIDIFHFKPLLVTHSSESRNSSACSC